MDVEETMTDIDYYVLNEKCQKAMTLLRSANGEIDIAMLEFKRGRAQQAKSRLARLQARLSAETENVEI